MYAIEFQAKVTNGHIEIPAEYRDQINGPIRVIVLIPPKPVKADMIQELLAHPLKVEDFRPLKREQIYERREE